MRRRNMKVLKQQSEIAIHGRAKDFLGMDDEPTDLSKRFLHRDMRVIEKCAFFMDVKLEDLDAAFHLVR